MVRSLYFLEGICIMILTGCLCAKTESNVQSRRAALTERFKQSTSFRKEEVITRQWKEQRNMSLVDFQLYDVKNRGTIAIAKYGDKMSGKVYCVDFYEYSPSIDQEGVLFLLCHDTRIEPLSGLEFIYDNGNVFVELTRESEDQTSGKVFRLSYSYKYGKNEGFAILPSEFHSIP